MADDGRPSEEQQRKLGLRFNHIGLRFPGQVLRLDLYRLLCLLHASKPILEQWDEQDEFCPLLGLREEFENAEIIRILLQTAIAIRFIGFGHADTLRANVDALNEPVGDLYENRSAATPIPLPLREACNKIIHGKNIIPASNDGGHLYERHLSPTIITCFNDFDQQTGWKAEIDLHRFIKACDAVLQVFS